MNENSQNAQVKDDKEAAWNRAYETIKDYDYFLPEKIRERDVIGIAKILKEKEGKHIAGVIALSAVIAVLLAFKQNSDVPKTIWSAVKIGLLSIIYMPAPLLVYYLITHTIGRNEYYGDDIDVKPKTRLKGFLLLLAACIGLSAIFVFGSM